MAFGDGGFDGDALVVNFEKMISLEGIKRHVLNKLKTFCILELNFDSKLGNSCDVFFDSK